MNTPEKDPKTGRFLTGNSGGGRQVGSRNKLSEKFLSDFHATWEELGVQALRDCATNNPKDFCKIAAMLVPREVQAEVVAIQTNLFADVRDFQKAYEIALDYIGAKPIVHDG
jgi:hypothetical protein